MPVVLSARRSELLQRAARDCEALGGRSLAVPADFTDPTQMRELANAAASAFGSIDVWVNNAGTSMWGPFEEIPLESQARLIELNLLGAINGSYAVLAYFFDRGGRGVIINVSSIGGLVPMPFAASYSASKFGLAGFTETLRSELAARSEIASTRPTSTLLPTWNRRTTRAAPSGRCRRSSLRSVSPSGSWVLRSGRGGPCALAPCTPQPSRTRLPPTRQGAWWAGWPSASCCILGRRRLPPTAVFSGRSRRTLR